jgi:hypothetical protein
MHRMTWLAGCIAWFAMISSSLPVRAQQEPSVLLWNAGAEGPESLAMFQRAFGRITGCIFVQRSAVSPTPLERRAQQNPETIFDALAGLTGVPLREHGCSGTPATRYAVDLAFPAVFIMHRGAAPRLEQVPESLPADVAGEAAQALLACRIALSAQRADHREVCASSTRTWISRDQRALFANLTLLFHTADQVPWEKLMLAYFAPGVEQEVEIPDVSSATIYRVNGRWWLRANGERIEVSEEGMRVEVLDDSCEGAVFRAPTGTTMLRIGKMILFRGPADMTAASFLRVGTPGCQRDQDGISLTTATVYPVGRLPRARIRQQDVAECMSFGPAASTRFTLSEELRRADGLADRWVLRLTVLDDLLGGRLEANTTFNHAACSVNGGREVVCQGARPAWHQIVILRVSDMFCIGDR